MRSMIMSPHERHEEHRKEDGFTLIELAVVILIIGILLAIAIPTFLGVRSRAQNKSSQSALRNSLIAAKTAYSDTGSYTGVTTASLTSIEPSINFVSAAATSAKPADVGVVIDATTATAGFIAFSRSDSGNCYAIMEVVGKTTKFATITTATPACTGASFPVGSALWTGAWS